MKALKVTVDWPTGIRAGGIASGDETMPTTTTWQCLSGDYEIRLCPDEMVNKYRGVEGIEVIEDETAIMAAVDAMQVDYYTVTSEALLAESLRQKNIKLYDIDNTLSMQDICKELLKRGALGIRHQRKVPETPVKMLQRLTLHADQKRRLGRERTRG